MVRRRSRCQRIRPVIGSRRVRPFMGSCECGCGQPTKNATKTNRRNGHVKGQPVRFVHGHHSRGIKRKKMATVKAYRTVMVAVNDSRHLHRVRAEKALGKPLPRGAVVHHADGSKNDDAPLVICQDSAYHRLLHVRMRIVEAGGNPNTDWICSTCRQAKSRDMFWAKRRATLGLCNECKSCLKEKRRRVAA